MEKLEEKTVIDAEKRTSVSDKNTITYCGFLLLKLGGMLLVFLSAQYLFVLLLGSRIAYFTDNYWIMVIAGLIPACIAKCKENNFWAWWFLGAYCPIISTFMAIGLDSVDD